MKVSRDDVWEGVRVVVVLMVVVLMVVVMAAAALFDENDACQTMPTSLERKTIPSCASPAVFVSVDAAASDDSVRDVESVLG